MKSVFTPHSLCNHVGFRTLPVLLALTMIGTEWSAQAQQSITGTSAVTQNFNGMGNSTTATLPAGFKMGADWSTGNSTTTAAAGTSGTGALTGSSGGGAYNFANGVTASSTDRSVGLLNTGSYTSPKSITYAFTNNTGSTITSLSLSWNYEKYRAGTRAFDWTFFHGSTSSPATAESAGDQSYAADAANAVVNPPTSTAKNVTLSGLNITNGGTYYLRWTFTGSGGSTNGQGIGIDDFSIAATTGAATPAIAPSVTSLSAFSAFEGAPSDPQTFTVSGTDLTANITVTAPTGFEVATDGATFGSTANLTAASGSASGTVSVRISGTAAVGTPSGNVTLSSTGAITMNVAVTGTVLASGTPILSSDAALTPFTSFAGSVSAAQAFNASGSNLTGNITVNAPTGFEVANEDGIFAPTATLVELAASAGGVISVRIAATAAAGPLTGNVTMSSPGASNIVIPVTGTVAQPTLTLVLAPASVSETAGAGASTGTVTVNLAPASDLTVALASGSVGNATVPESVVVPAGQTTATFPVAAVPNPASYASGTSVITASAAGYTSGNATLTVLNVEVAPVTRISLASTSDAYTQNFDGLGATSVPAAIPSTAGVPASLGAITNPTMNGWYGAKLSGSSTAANALTADAGGGNSGFVYSYGANGTTDRALGVLASASNTMAIGALIKNDTGATLTGLKFSFTAEFWRSSTSVQNVLTFAYGKVDGTIVTEANFLTLTNNSTFSGTSAFAGLNITGPAPVASNGALDGNNAANQSAFTDVTLPVNLAPGEVVFIRWQDANDGGNDAGLAIDNLSITPVAAAVAAPVISGTLTLNGTVGTAVTPYQITASGSPTSYASDTLPGGLTLNATTGIISGTPSAATSGTDVQISATNGGGTGNATLTITIAKGTPTIQTPPTASDITEGAALSASTLTGGSASVAGSFAWTSPTTVPPLGTAGYSVTFTPTDTANYDTAPLSVNVNVVSADYLFPTWSGNATLTSDLLTKFAIGGAASPTAPGETPVVAVEGGSLTLTAIIRTNNSKLTVAGEAVADLAGTWSTSGVTGTAVGVDQTGVPQGCERQKFSVAIGGAKKFLRLKSTLLP